MKPYKIVYDKDACIGAGACYLVASDFWNLQQDLAVGSRADLVGSKIDKKSKTFELEIDEKDLEINLEAARSCPVKCIQIIERKTGKKLI